MSQNRGNLLNWLILLALAFTWGSSFILMKRGLENFSALQVACMRIFIAFLVLLPLAIPKIKSVPKKYWRYIFLVAFLGNFIPAFLFTRAQLGLSSSLTGMLNSLTPLFTLLLGVFLFQLKVTRQNVIGIIIGFAGAAGLIIANPEGTFSGNFGYSIYVILATILYASSVNIIKKFLQEINSVAIAALGFLMVGPPAGIYLFTTDFTEIMSNTEGAWTSLGYVALLAIFGTALAIILFNTLIKRTSALFGSSVTYMIPVFAMIWGLLDGEVITFLQLIFIGIILLGVYLVNLKRKPKIIELNQRHKQETISG